MQTLLQAGTSADLAKESATFHFPTFSDHHKIQTTKGTSGIALWWAICIFVFPLAVRNPGVAATYVAGWGICKQEWRRG